MSIYCCLCGALLPCALVRVGLQELRCLHTCLSDACWLSACLVRWGCISGLQGLGQQLGGIQFNCRNQESLWPHACGHVRAAQAYGMVNGLAPEGVDLKGAAALQPTDWLQVTVLPPDSAEAAAALAREAATVAGTALTGSSGGEGAAAGGFYSADAPFVGRLAAARCETADWSDRRVLHLEVCV